jgi:hypothetical protein
MGQQQIIKGKERKTFFVFFFGDGRNWKEIVAR